MTSKIQDLIFLGATPFPEIIEIVHDINALKPTYKVLGILDDDPKYQGKDVLGFPVLGPLDLVSKHPDALFVMGIASFKSRIGRYEVLQRLKLPRERYATLIHPSVKVYSTASVGCGCIIHAGTVILNQSVLEDFIVLSPNTVIGPCNLICEGVMTAPQVAITAGNTIGHYAHIGAGVSIGDRVKVGPGVQIGMGTTVTREVEPGVFIFGTPPKKLSKMEVPAALMDRWNAALATRG